MTGVQTCALPISAPSAASRALQEELAAELEKAATEVAEAAAEDPEVAAAVDEAVDEAVEEAAVEEAVAEAVTPTLGLLNLDKSGIAKDGLTDLQIRLKLADATEGMEDVIKGAVVGVVSNANETGYRTATNQEINTLGYALSYAGGNIIEFDMAGTFDKAAVEEAVNKALEEGGYSVNAIDFIQYDAEAEAARIAEEQAAAEQAQAETETAEEAGEETAETEASAEETAEAEATEAPAEETAEAEATEAPADETTEAEATEAPAEENAEAVTEPTESAGFQLRILIDMDDVTSQVRAQLEREMVAKYPNFRFVSIDHVSAIAGRDLLSNAIKALLIAFVCMLIYIAIRFSPLSGAAALFALLHDILIMCAFMVFFRGLFQVNSPFIAAILTIVGYSINNTIIIFDRIRETRAKPGYTQMDMMDVVEVSVSSTLSRTINTTLTTLFTLVCLYIFGVSSIKEFAFPLLVGMLAGTYSSVLLSGQVWAMWDKKLNANKAKKA